MAKPRGKRRDWELPEPKTVIHKPRQIEFPKSQPLEDRLFDSAGTILAVLGTLIFITVTLVLAVLLH